MTVAQYARKMEKSVQSVYQKIRNNSIPYTLDKDGCICINDDQPWIKRRPGRRACLEQK